MYNQTAIAKAQQRWLNDAGYSSVGQWRNDHLPTGLVESSTEAPHVVSRHFGVRRTSDRPVTHRVWADWDSMYGHR